VKVGLPDRVLGCLFDMDGVLTQTATVHAKAWKQMFDPFLDAWNPQHGVSLPPFDPVQDYELYVDGKSRLDGARGFLAARGITLAEGSPDDASGAWTVNGLSRRKNEIVLELLSEGNVRVFDDAVEYVKAVRDAGIPRAVVSASANTVQVLQAAGLTELFDARIDGIVAAEKNLAGKPAPDMYLAGAEALHLAPANAAVFEDAIAGVEAGRAGQFGIVIGVDRVGQAGALAEHGANIVVTRLTELLERQ
jgi:beta-phosphoglucomutase family hydrolase